MPLLWPAFWTVVILGSILWYAAMLVGIGFKAGREIGELVGRLKAQAPDLADSRSRGSSDDS